MSVLLNAVKSSSISQMSLSYDPVLDIIRDCKNSDLLDKVKNNV